jgi:hypothetical protein
MDSSEKFQREQKRSSFGTAATELDFLAFDKELGEGLTGGACQMMPLGTSPYHRHAFSTLMS